MGEARDRRLRLLVVTTNLGGGTGTHLALLLGELHARGHEVRVLCQGELETPLAEGIVTVEGPAPAWWDRFPLAQLRRFRQLQRVVREWRPDLVHAYFFWPVVYARLLRRAGAIHALVENREDLGFNLSASDSAVLRATASTPDRVICVSEAVREVVEVREGLDAERLRVVHNGVAIAEVRGEGASDLDASTRLREELGFGPEDRIVGMVANLNRVVKGVRYFIEAVPRIVEREPRVRFLIVGEGAERARHEARARELGVADRIVFAGYRPDVPRIYPLMEISTLTSLSEGLSITLLESMSFGLPVVATRVGGNPELVRAGETGILVPAGDPEAFADAVGALLADPERARRMGARGREVVEREFSVSAVADRYEEVYAEAVGARSTRE